MSERAVSRVAPTVATLIGAFVGLRVVGRGRVDTRATPR